MYQIDFNHPSSIYFVGIGGISMSGLAEILADAGFRVSGSDRSKSPLTETLERKGITVFYGQRAANITDDIDCVVFTSAIHKDNPEYIATMEKGIPHLTRAQLLGEIMQNYKTPIAISGTHGKTTTTSMVSEILLHAGTDPHRWNVKKYRRQYPRRQYRPVRYGSLRIYQQFFKLFPQDRYDLKYRKGSSGLFQGY